MTAVKILEAAVTLSVKFVPKDLWGLKRLNLRDLRGSFELTFEREVFVLYSFQFHES